MPQPGCGICFLYIENPALGAGGSKTLIAMGQDEKLLLM